MYEIKLKEIENIVGKAFLSGFGLGNEEGFMTGQDSGFQEGYNVGYEECLGDYDLTEDDNASLEGDEADEE